jgi:hypothetical protein
MTPLLLVLLIAVVLLGLGFAMKVLWWIALVAMLVWALALFFRGARSNKERGGRGGWYRW